jgi:hypothetical protein
MPRRAALEKPVRRWRKMGFDDFPKQLPRGADVEPPSSGWIRVPPEKPREIFPWLSRLIDLGWDALVNEERELSWRIPLLPEDVCVFCGQPGELVGTEARLVSGIPGWDAEYETWCKWRCPICGYEWIV